MNRVTKNIILSIVIVLSILALGTTIYIANKSIATNKTDITIKEGSNQPPEMPDGEMPSEPHTDKDGWSMPEGGSGEPPEKPSGNMQDPPSMPNGQNGQNGQPPELKENGNTSSNSTSISTGYYIAYSIEGLILSLSVMYLILSKFNKLSFKETIKDSKNIIILILATIIITTAITLGASGLTKNNTQNDSSSQPGEMSQNSKVTYSAKTDITEDKTISNETYESTDSDQNAISVSGYVDVTLNKVTVNKTGDSDGGDATSFYGTNSAIIAKDGANLTIKNATITTNANGANGVFSYGGSATTNNTSSDGTTITISDSKITTTQNNSGGIMTTGGGTTIAKNLTVETSGTSSAAIRSDRGGGIVKVDGGTYTSHGQGSPAIYSTANITVENAKLISTASEGVVIEGENTVTLKNVELIDTNNKLNGQSTTYKNIFLYRSMSGDAKDGTSTFSSTDSTITTNKGDTFYITNTTTIINLTNNKITNKDSSGNFLRAEAGSWGTEGSNGGQVTLNTNNQKFAGNIVIDSISTLTMNMTNSTYSGTINSSNEAKEINIKLDKNSKIKLTGDSYITSLDDEDTSYSNIDFNGYKLYVNGQSLK